MQLKKGQIVEVTIEKLAFGGKGIGELEDGRKVFVEGAVPGDKIEASLTKIKKNYAEAQLERIIAGSDLRVEARCKHFDTCGGCKWQMLKYEDQLRFKEEQVRETLSHIGGITEGLVQPIIGCSDPWFYRNKMEFSFGDLSKEDTSIRLGLHPAGKWRDVFDIEECFLGSERVAEILARVREFAAGMDKELLVSLFVREGKKTGDIMVNLVTTDDFEGVSKFAEICLDLTSVYWTVIKRKRGMPTQFKEHLLSGKPCIRDRIGGLEFKISPQSFFQPNTAQAEVLYEKVKEFACLTGEEVLFDLYCGTGTIGLYCADGARQVYGLEVNSSAIADAKQNALMNGIDNAEFLCGDVYEKILEIPACPDVVIVDPPRSGLGEKVALKITSLEPSRIVYVSCDPASLARDLRGFEESGYKVEQVQPVDMFPHTYHIENVCLLRKLC
ncbi:MAG: 23S rRNA (uracil(1939)-C(5))-methyltransferase RlmD [Patescibacteria group bacterium]|nr:23S rRNA (uracil(1939)-C(5))-methyltransferase RlmD [Patescibacteria group bacterium]